MKTFQDQVVWITGASSGIGEALALELARQGARLVLSARRTHELERVRKATGLPDDRVLVLPLDVTDFAAAVPATERVLGYFQRIDCVVHNAGVSQRSYVKDTDLEVYRQLMDVDFFSTVALTKAVLPHMLRQQSGHFIVISSVAGKIGTLMRSGYNAAKHALHGFYDSLRAECHQDHIGVTIICPGYIRTNVSVNALDEKGQKHGQMDANQARGLSAEACARRIGKAVLAGKQEVYIGGLTEVTAVYLKRFWPGLLHRLVRRTPPE
jgi:NADP-dependent 3-hydroxy acid dehydrogenase YdfG